MHVIWDKYDKLRKAALSITKNKDDAHDLAMEVCMMMMDKPEAPEWYMYTVMRNQWFNKYSTFNKKYGKLMIDKIDIGMFFSRISFELYMKGEEHDDTQLEALKAAPLTDLELKMLSCYVECNFNASAVSRKYKISREVVNRTIHEVKYKLKNEYNRIINNPD